MTKSDDRHVYAFGAFVALALPATVALSSFIAG